MPLLQIALPPIEPQLSGPDLKYQSNQTNNGPFINKRTLLKEFFHNFNL